MKETFTRESIALNDGEIEIWDSKILIATTDSFLHKHVESIRIARKAFVKPVDVYKLASEHFMHLNEPHDAPAYFMAGYNTNPKEFTREQLIEAMKYASSHLSSLKGIMCYIDQMGELSIPESVTIENNQVISVVWT